MRMTEIQFQGRPPIDGYAPGGFRIAGRWHAGHLILTPRGVTSMSEARMSEEGLAPILAERDAIDLVLIGQGFEIAPFPAALRRIFETAGLRLETMSTPSACRTYNVLLTEDRRVGAVLLAI